MANSHRPSTQWWFFRVFYSVVLAALSLGAVLLVYRFFVVNSTGQFIDGLALEGAGLHQGPSLKPLFEVLEVISFATIGLALVIFLVIATMRRQFATGIAAVLVVVGSNVTTQILKETLGRVPYYQGDPGVNSLPSGHATAAASLAIALLFVLPVAFRGLWIVVGVAATALTGTATVAALWHRPSDVLAALAVVTCWSALAALGYLLYSRARGLVEQKSGAGTIVANSVVVLIGLVLIIVGLYCAWLSARTDPEAVGDWQLNIAWIGSSCGVVGATALAFWAISVVLPFTRALGREERFPENAIVF